MFIINFFKKLYRQWHFRRQMKEMRKRDPFIY
jgi:hypothetical protein